MVESKSRVGLALSGGGFRAAFYHVGVLARLADEDRLRDVEVVSAVSGGSIVAALYGLRVRRLLESKSHDDVSAKDYQRVVWHVGHDLRRAVRRNLRMRLFSNPGSSLKMLRSDYTRSDRMAHLYERHLYRGLGETKEEQEQRIEVPRKKMPWWRRWEKPSVRMQALLVHPGGQPFNPDKDNEGRKAKVPVTLLNATVLNTGHNWRFEGIRMGEPPHRGDRGKVNDRIDKNLRLKRAQYTDLGSTTKKTVDHANFPLKYAVAASTAVPGVFAPLSLSGLYRGVRVLLVDGGVHDNQGVQGLIDRGCTEIMVSDASGQLDDHHHPGTSILRVLPRANSIMADRMREGQLTDPPPIIDPATGQTDGRTAIVRLTHLMDGVHPPELHPIQAGEAGASTKAMPDSAETHQQALAGIRTDLDAFHDVEAYALAKNGYEGIADADRARQSGVQPMQWPFLRVEEVVPEAKRLRLLRLGKSKFAKPFLVNAGMRAAGLALFALLAWGLGRAGSAVGWSNVFGVPGLAVAGALLLYVLLLVLVQRFVPTKGIGSWVRGIVRGVPGVPLALVGMVLTNAYLWFLNGIYLRAGEVPGGDWPEAPDALASVGRTHAPSLPASS